MPTCFMFLWHVG